MEWVGSTLEQLCKRIAATIAGTALVIQEGLAKGLDLWSVMVQECRGCLLWAEGLVLPEWPAWREAARNTVKFVGEISQ